MVVIIIISVENIFAKIIHMKFNEYHLFETEVFCNILNVTFDQFNVFLLNKSISFFAFPFFLSYFTIQSFGGSRCPQKY